MTEGVAKVVEKKEVGRQGDAGKRKRGKGGEKKEGGEGGKKEEEKEEGRSDKEEDKDKDKKEEEKKGKGEKEEEDKDQVKDRGDGTEAIGDPDSEDIESTKEDGGKTEECNETGKGDTDKDGEPKMSYICRLTVVGTTGDNKDKTLAHGMCEADSKKRCKYGAAAQVCTSPRCVGFCISP